MNNDIIFIRADFLLIRTDFLCKSAVSICKNGGFKCKVYVENRIIMRFFRLYKNFTNIIPCLALMLTALRI